MLKIPTKVPTKYENRIIIDYWQRK